MNNNLHPTSNSGPPQHLRGKTHKPLRSGHSEAEEALFKICCQQMAKGSLSFYTAARLLPAAQRRLIFLLYGWCRAMDDLIDGQNLGHRSHIPVPHPSPFVPSSLVPTDEEILARSHLLARLQQDTHRIMTDRDWYQRQLAQFLLDPSGTGGKQPPSPSGQWALLAMGYLAHEKGLHPFYAQELLKGMGMDLHPPSYNQLRDLEVYCYHVAGVVGVMYCDLVGLRDEQAKAYAADLGMAMQLTNICRDILDDAQIGRIYLPRALMEQYGIPFDPHEMRGYKEALADLAEELLTRADVLYARAALGFRHLPWRAALAACAACHIYRQIGVEIRRKKAHAWDTRCRVPTRRKIMLVLRAGAQILAEAPFRWRHPWHRQIPQTLWRFHP